MTREEQIRQAGIEYTIKNRPMCIGGDAFSEIVDGMNRNHAFEEGAKWADKTMIEKACKWLQENVNKYSYVIKVENTKYRKVHFTESLIEDFSKAMEE